MNIRTQRNKPDFSTFSMAQHFVVLEKLLKKKHCLLRAIIVVEQILDFNAGEINVSAQTFCPKWILHRETQISIGRPTLTPSQIMHFPSFSGYKNLNFFFPLQLTTAGWVIQTQTDCINVNFKTQFLKFVFIKQSKLRLVSTVNFKPNLAFRRHSRLQSIQNRSGNECFLSPANSYVGK